MDGMRKAYTKTVDPTKKANTEDAKTAHISLRDYFAGCALNGMLMGGLGDASVQETVFDAYKYADEMLIRRKEKP